MRRPTRILAALAVIAMDAHLAEAQATWEISGVVVDSLRTKAPMAGVRVHLVGSSRTSITDSRGTFQIDAGEATAVTLQVTETWLDSLGLDVSARVTRASGTSASSVALLVPSLASVQRGLCGRALDATRSVVVGVLHLFEGADPRSATVRARWWEAAETPDELPRLMEVADSAETDGSFVLCDLPRDSNIRLEHRAGQSSASRRIVLSEGLSRWDIVLDTSNVRSSVEGRVVDRSGRPIVGAEVQLTADSSVRTASGPDGAFVLQRVPRASGLLLVRSPGYLAVEVELQPLESRVQVADVALDVLPARLRGVRIVARTNSSREAFEVRRRGAVGRFLDDSTLAALPRKSLHAVADLAPGLAVAPGGRAPPSLRLRRGGTWCAPRFFIDGVDVGRLDSPEQAGEQGAYVEMAVRIEVYSAASAPPRFSDADGCGAIVVWTR